MTQAIFVLPDLGEGLMEAQLVRWLVAQGDEVAVDEPVAEVETAKAMVEIPTPYAGVIAALHGTEGEVIAVGAPLISITTTYIEEERAGSGNVLIGYGTSPENTHRRRRNRRAPATTSAGPVAADPDSAGLPAPVVPAPAGSPNVTNTGGADPGTAGLPTAPAPAGLAAGVPVGSSAAGSPAAGQAGIGSGAAGLPTTQALAGSAAAGSRAVTNTAAGSVAHGPADSVAGPAAGSPAAGGPSVGSATADPATAGSTGGTGGRLPVGSPAAAAGIPVSSATTSSATHGPASAGVRSAAGTRSPETGRTAGAVAGSALASSGVAATHSVGARSVTSGSTGRVVAGGAAVSSASVGGGRPPVSSPVVRKLAKDNGVDLAAVRGSGPGGVITRADVVRAIAAGVDSRTGLGVAERIPLRGIRGAIAARLARSRAEIPEATTWVDVDATELVRLRAEVPGGPGLLAYVARFVVAGLSRHPVLNSAVDDNEIRVFDGVNLGIAVQAERGLVVPVVRDAHRRTTRALDAEIRRVTAAARDGDAQVLSGGSFTLNNYGSFGVDGSAAIINHPEVAILGMGRIIERPWVVGGEIRARHVTQLSLVFDHRVCDGGTAAGFLRFVADAVESPQSVLADL